MVARKLPTAIVSLRLTVRVRRGSLFAALVPETTNLGEGERFFFASRLTPGADELERAHFSRIMTDQIDATRGSSARVPEGDTGVTVSQLTVIATVPNPTQVQDALVGRLRDIACLCSPLDCLSATLGTVWPPTLSSCSSLVDNLGSQICTAGRTRLLPDLGPPGLKGCYTSRSAYSRERLGPGLSTRRRHALLSTSFALSSRIDQLHVW